MTRRRKNLTNPVVILGAGATKACGGPLTNEILSEVFTRRNDLYDPLALKPLEAFLIENFHLPKLDTDRRWEDYPPLPLLLSLIDLGRDRKEPFKPMKMHNAWYPESRSSTGNSLASARRSLEYAISALLENMLDKVNKPLLHSEMVTKIFPGNMPPKVISFNYDIIIDKTLTDRTKNQNDADGTTLGIYPDYGCDITQKNSIEGQDGDSGLLLKLHGSLNWLYCPGCHRMEVRENKVAHNVATQPPCSECGTKMQAVLITPTYFKDYRNPHIAQIWYKAQRLLRSADHVYFIGYSLPDDDVHITYLLKRSLAHLPANAMTVVEMDKCKRSLKDNPVGSRYRILFGDGIDWHPEGMEEWLTTL